eukprot:gnl/MRDRNA2_/MRDRNA2_76702_c0_seq1.p1 gnl/MRDRNA2_/MRDRNA2_76702_c0~~gnl/MRDRNA2_/MRDRNA2_76702_c0_seq1.p1  ORF type:complete len:325 (-),score=55.35 gnl/MRDRNA2_/MRDRNA2_76702_c0_seq1:10-984(-)
MKHQTGRDHMRKRAIDTVAIILFIFLELAGSSEEFLTNRTGHGMHSDAVPNCSREMQKATTQSLGIKDKNITSLGKNLVSTGKNMTRNLTADKRNLTSKGKGRSGKKDSTVSLRQNPFYLDPSQRESTGLWQNFWNKYLTLTKPSSESAESSTLRKRQRNLSKAQQLTAKKYKPRNMSTNSTAKRQNATKKIKANHTNATREKLNATAKRHANASKRGGRKKGAKGRRKKYDDIFGIRKSLEEFCDVVSKIHERPDIRKPKLKGSRLDPGSISFVEAMQNDSNLVMDWLRDIIKLDFFPASTTPAPELVSSEAGNRSIHPCIHV